MIITQLLGGLGNQLFQYALGRRLAHDHGVPLKLDVKFYQQHTLRAYKLHHFNIQAEIAADKEINRFVGKEPYRKAMRWLQRRVLPYERRPLVKERTLAFDPAVLRTPSDAYLEGYWQSEHYFHAIERLLRDELTFKTPPDSANARLLDQIRGVSNSISLHVRRGDYVTSKEVNSYLGIIPLDYYREAIKRIVAAIPDAHFFVFSDDPGWVRANISTDHPITYVTHNGADKDYEDLRLMANCRHHIIANSSFSWWGAWLASTPEQIVYAPQRWGNNPELNHSDRIPEHWQRI